MSTFLLVENPQWTFKWNCRHEYTHIWAHKVVRGYGDIVYVDGSNTQEREIIYEYVFAYGHCEKWYDDIIWPCKWFNEAFSSLYERWSMHLSLLTSLIPLRLLHG